MSIIDVGTADHVRAKERNRKSSAALLARLIKCRSPSDAPSIAAEPEPLPTESVEEAEIPRLPSPDGGHRTAFQKWIDSFEPLPTTYPTVHQIKKCVAEHFGVSVIDIDSPRRTANVVRPRQIAIYLTRQLTPRSLPDIGRKFGGRDHTTIIWSVRKIENLVNSDASFANLISALTAKVRA